MRHPLNAEERVAKLTNARRPSVYEVEVTDAAGKEWDMKIDATTSKVLKDEADD